MVKIDLKVKKKEYRRDLVRNVITLTGLAGIATVAGTEVLTNLQDFQLTRKEIFDMYGYSKPMAMAGAFYLSTSFLITNYIARFQDTYRRFKKIRKGEYEKKPVCIFN